MPSPFGSVLVAARQCLALQLRWRLLLWLVVLAAFCFGLAYLLAVRAPERVDGRTLFCLLAWWLGAVVLLPWGTLYLGVTAVHGPLEDRTCLYEFLRPAPRACLLLGKCLAVAVVSALAASVIGTALYFGVASQPERWVDGLEPDLLLSFLQIYAIAACAYAASAAFFSACFRRPLAWGAFFVVGLQMLTANLPVSAGLRQLTITDPLRRLVLDLINPDQRLARALWPAEREYQPDLTGAPIRDLLVFTGVSLLLALWTYSKTEYDARHRE